MDKIFITQLQLDATIGIYPHEKQHSQSLLLDIELMVDMQKAATTDAIADTLDYDKLASRLQQLTAASRFNLLEALAEHLAQTMLQEFPIQEIRLRINKPGALANSLATAQGVGIEITRQRR